LHLCGSTQKKKLQREALYRKCVPPNAGGEVAGMAKTQTKKPQKTVKAAPKKVR